MVMRTVPFTESEIINIM